MALEKEVIEITEREFRTLDFSTIDAASILGTSEAELIRRYGSREGRPITYDELIYYGRLTKGMTPEQIREKILKVCNYVVVSEDKIKREYPVKIKMFFDEFYKKFRAKQ
ncbi:MAG: hypothetical protein QW666_02400 [Candidatus Woesearchaeota archaeon]